MMDATYHPSIMPRSGFWRSFAAFTSASLIRPPPMTSHLFDRATNANVGTLISTVFDVDPNSQTKLASSPFLFFNKFMDRRTETENKIAISDKVDLPRIAIIGGGIAGVTAASSLVKRLDKENQAAKIVLFEQDSEGGQRSVAFGDCQQPVWTAATARNANSMVPGAAMHVMSQRSTLGQIFVDTCNEVVAHVIEQMRGYTKIPYTSNIDNFDVKPPYFALHLIRCIGPSASWDERMSFLEFMRHFVVISVLTGEKEAHERGSFIQQLARSNRVLFLEAIKQNPVGKDLSERMGTNKGFLSLHRTREAALHAEEEGKEFNELSEMIPIEDAMELEPRIAKLPMASNLYAVHRKDDYTANSAVFVQDLVEQIKARGIEYRCGTKGTIRGIVTSKEGQKGVIGKETQVLATSARDSRFRITTEDGITQNFDYLVLAAGVNSPLVAKKIEAERTSASIFQSSICPTYPLRGYSLTVYTNHTKQDVNDRTKKGRSTNLLNRPISVDDMYCSSVGANMARMAGFGELVGYRDKAKDVPSLAPKVMARYCKTIFPESDATEEHALQCFRPMTPDDIPLVGRVSSVPGLYLHTGHGTLGWTLCLATADCVAQDVCDGILGRDSHVFDLPDNVQVDKSKLSPDRFM